jgi:tetratricopeptide (TPR) repeat protein
MPAKRLIQYAVVGVFGLVLLGGAYYLFGAGKQPDSTASTAPPASTAPDDEPTVPTQTQNEKAMRFVANARQLAGEGKFDEADAALQKADKVVPNSPEVEQARRDIAAMKTPEGQLTTQLTDARFAVEHGDYTAADKALAAAERLNPQAPEIAELKKALETAKAKDTHRADRITRHLTAMREAIARHDFATADSALDAAERIAVDDPEVRQARSELTRARAADQKKDSAK